MEQLWYYLDSNHETQGPLEPAALLQAIRSSGSGGNTLVWTEGMHDWTPANACEELLRIVSASRSAPSPPPRPRPSQPSATAKVADGRSIAHDASVHPWRRFFARQMDIFLVAILLGIITGIVVEPGSSVDKALNNNALFGVLTVLILAPVEGIMLAVLGSTLGKAVYAISIGRNDRKPLRFGQAMSRSFRVYVQGMALGIPLISLITIYLGYRTLRQTGTTSWDKDGGLSVRHARLSWLRITIIVVVWSSLLALIALGIYAKVEGL